MDRKTAIFLNGGAGRMVSSIPAVEKYLEENPDKDPILICEGGTDVFKGHPSCILEHMTIGTKICFKIYLKIEI